MALKIGYATGVIFGFLTRRMSVGVTGWSAPGGYVLLLGADGAQLLGADGAPLYAPAL